MRAANIHYIAIKKKLWQFYGKYVIISSGRSAKSI